MATRKKLARESQRYFLSYDLGLRGAYDSIYEWLDAKGAKECGDSVATFHSDRTADELRDEIAEVLGDVSKARIYLISLRSGGKFLIGKRKAAPWAGYFQGAVENVLDQ